jgi:hypothetical protein
LTARALLWVLVSAIASGVAVVAFHTFAIAYPQDYVQLGAVLHAAPGAARSSSGTTLVIDLTRPYTVTLSSGVNAGGTVLDTETLGKAPTVTTASGSTASFVLDPNGNATLNGAACSQVTISVGTKSYAVQCNPWVVTP